MVKVEEICISIFPNIVASLLYALPSHICSFLFAKEHSPTFRLSLHIPTSPFHSY